jgi:5,10-methenyltetrahydrofolate synthetase
MKFRGRVIEGQKLARTLGAPTANLSFSQRPKIKNGVWLVRVRFSGTEYGGILHAGIRNTDKQWALEVHVLDFDGDLVGKILEIETIEFVRETMRFSAISALSAQIKLDMILAQKFFIREKIRLHWDSLLNEERNQLAKSAVEQISILPEFQSSKMIYIFAPDKREISFVQELCSLFPEKQFAFPFVRGWDMKFYISLYEELVSGKFEIQEPVPENLAGEPDLILVPAVAAATTGERLGRGGGYYDEFLSKTKVPTICILPKWAVLPKIPFEARDQRIGKVIGV